MLSGFVRNFGLEPENSRGNLRMKIKVPQLAEWWCGWCRRYLSRDSTGDGHAIAPVVGAWDRQASLNTGVARAINTRWLTHVQRKSAPGRIRTYDQRIRRPLLYPLSYGGAGSRVSVSGGWKNFARNKSSRTLKRLAERPDTPERPNTPKRPNLPGAPKHAAAPSPRSQPRDSGRLLRFFL